MPLSVYFTLLQHFLLARAKTLLYRSLALYENVKKRRKKKKKTLFKLHNKQS